MVGKLILEDGSIFEGVSFGAEKNSAGEVVFSTGMVGYPESLTDPSYLGQILILTYPIIGSYGVPDKKYWESDTIKISALIVSQYIDTPSHFQNKMDLSSWLKENNVPALEITDTRFLTKKIRKKGTMLGKIVFQQDIDFYNPDKENLVAKVSTKKIITQGEGKKRIILIDCGAKKNIARSLLKRNIQVTIVPWDCDPTLNSHPPSGNSKFDGIVISNGPGDPKMATKTIENVKKILAKKIPILGICLGNQILALAGEGDTQKLKFGHRSHNQPCLLQQTNMPAHHLSQILGIADRCYITTQNHGFTVNKLPTGFKPWFINANDNTNEGMIHESLPFMSVQFHPEATPGPEDTNWIFDYFLERI